MVRIKGNTLGHLSGKMDGRVYRIMNGKLFASNRPEKYNASKSKASVSNRSKFAVATEFAAYINSIPILKSIWKTARLKGSAPYHRIIKYNSKYAADYAPTVFNIITPPAGSNNTLNFPLKEFLFNAKEKNINLLLSKPSNNFTYDINYNLVFVFVFLEPIKIKDKYFLMSHMEENIVIKQDMDEINIKAGSSLSKYLKKYKKLIIYQSFSAPVEGRPKYLWTNSRGMVYDL